MTRWRLAAETPCGYRPRQIVLGDTGVGLGETDLGDALLDRIGLQRLGSERAIGHLSQVGSTDPTMIGYETDFMVGMGAYPYVRATGNARSHLSVQPTIGADSVDLVVTGPGGGYAHGDAILSDDPRLGSSLWILNPFGFLAASLPDHATPIPDTTTRNGLRLFFSTVTPEGWLEPEPSRFFGQDVAIAGELLLGSLIAPYPDLPVTVSVAHGDFDAAIAGPLAERGRNAAQAIFALPQVSAATSGHDLVYDWALFDDGAQVQQPARALRAPRLLSGLLPRSAADRSTISTRRYQSSPPDLSREISGALGQLAALLPEHKSAATLLWIRNSMPTQAVLAEAANAGAIGFGGGVQPSNPSIPTLSGLPPLSARLGDQLQVYDPLGDDAAYTGNWIGDLTGFHALERTLDWSDIPRRLTPFHLSYSARAALHFSTRASVQRHLALAQDGNFAPTTVSDYVSMVQGFDTVRFQPQGDLSWRVYDRGGLQTLRFAHADTLSLAMETSAGVLGAIRKGEDLYISLDPDFVDPLVVLVDDPGPAGVRPVPGSVAIAESNLVLSGFYRDGCATGLTATGYGPGHVTGLTVPGGRIDVSVSGTETALMTEDDGSFRLEIPEPGQTAIVFRSDCGEG